MATPFPLADKVKKLLNWLSPSFYGFYNVKNLGAKGDGITDDTAIIQSIINSCHAAGGGTVFIPPGTYIISSTLTIPFGTHIILRGAGLASILKWNIDLGVNTYAIEWGPFASFVNNIYMMIENLYIIGPGTSTTPGTIPTNMSGVRLERKCEIVGCRIQGFYAGIRIYGNHQRVHRSTVRANFYNVYFESIDSADQMIGQNYGDQSFIDCDLHGATFSCVAVGDNNGIINTNFVACQFGFAPYSFYRESAPTAGAFMSGVTFSSCNSEQIGNAIIYCEDSDSNYDVIRNSVFIAGGISTAATGAEPSTIYNNTYKIPARNQDYSFKVGTLEDTQFLGGSWFVSDPGDIGIVQARNFRRCEINGADRLLDNIVNYLGRPAFTALSTNGDFSGIIISTGVQICKVGKPVGIFDVNEVLELSAGNLRLYSGGSSISPVVGVSLEAGNTATGLERVVYVVSGKVTCKGFGVTAGNWLRPNRTTLGEVSEAVSGSNNPVTIPSGSTSVIVNHSLVAIPRLDEIQIMPTSSATNDYGNFWISNNTETQFTINVRTDPGAGGASFAWNIKSTDIIGYALTNSSSGVLQAELIGRL